MEKILCEENILSAALELGRYFVHMGVSKAAVPDVLAFTKEIGLRRSEIKEARKRIGIQSKRENGIQYWCWPKNVDPEEFCSKKNAEIWEIINAGSRN